MRLHIASAGYGTCGPFATAAIRTRLHLPRTTRLALRASRAGSVGKLRTDAYCIFSAVWAKNPNIRDFGTGP